MELITEFSSVSTGAAHLPSRSELHQGIRQEWKGSCELELFESLPSTHHYLSQKLDRSSALPRACVASRQTAGVGRRGKTWLSSSNCITLSLAQSFAQPANQLMGLSLVAGIAVVGVLESYFKSEFRIKWPNDILVMSDDHPLQGKKLAGILTELKLIGSTSNPVTYAITGVGLNVSSGEELNRVDQPFATLEDVLSKPVARPSVDELSGRLIGAILSEFDRFSVQGWECFAKEWMFRDYLLGREVRVEREGGPIYAMAKGVNNDGALIIDIDGQQQAVYSGEVSVRAV